MSKKPTQEENAPLLRRYEEDEFKPEMTTEAVKTRILTAQSFKDGRRVEIYKEISEKADLPNLFELRPGLRQPILNLLAQDVGVRFRFKLSEKAQKLIDEYNEKIRAGEPPQEVTAERPCQLLWSKGESGAWQVAGLGLRDGQDRETEIDAACGEIFELNAFSAIFLWAHYGSTICDEKPIAVFPSLFGLVDYLGRVKSEKRNRTEPPKRAPK